MMQIGRTDGQTDKQIHSTICLAVMILSCILKIATLYFHLAATLSSVV